MEWGYPSLVSTRFPEVAKWKRCLLRLGVGIIVDGPESFALPAKEASKFEKLACPAWDCRQMSGQLKPVHGDRLCSPTPLVFEVEPATDSKAYVSGVI